MNHLSIITQVIAERGDRERQYNADISVQWDEQVMLNIEYITAIKYEKEPDPQISKDPVVSTGFSVLVFSPNITEEDLRILVECELNEIEKIGISYE